MKLTSNQLTIKIAVDSSHFGNNGVPNTASGDNCLRLSTFNMRDCHLV
jgi:hypothetical protein